MLCMYYMCLISTRMYFFSRLHIAALRTYSSVGIGSTLLHIIHAYKCCCAGKHRRAIYILFYMCVSGGAINFMQTYIKVQFKVILIFGIIRGVVSVLKHI